MQKTRKIEKVTAAQDDNFVEFEEKHPKQYAQ
jgi:hypothetical protein